MMIEQLLTFIPARNSIDLHSNLSAEFMVLVVQQSMSSPFWLTKIFPLGQLHACAEAKQSKKYNKIMPSCALMTNHKQVPLQCLTWLLLLS